MRQSERRPWPDQPAMTDPILLDIPDRFDTERLTIRVPRAGDGPSVNAAVIESLDTLRPWMPWAQSAPSLEQSEINCRKAWAQFLLRNDITLRLYLKGTDTCVGSSGLHQIDWSVPKFEIGYWVGQRHEGQGLATEAVRAIADFAVASLAARRLEIRTDSRNERSRRVAERAGFRLDAILNHSARDMHGDLCHMCLYMRPIDAG